jgi:hypothetical protein
MVAKNQEEIEIIKQELRSKLLPYSEEDNNNEEHDIGISKTNDSEEINEDIDSFRYPAILLIGDTGE